MLAFPSYPRIPTQISEQSKTVRALKTPVVSNITTAFRNDRNLNSITQSAHSLHPSLMSANIDLQLHPWGVFHGGDEIRGTVKVRFLSNIEVKNIQVKLIGISKTQYTQSTGQSTIVHEEKHDLVYDVVTIFPPPNMDGVLQSSKYTLPEGKTLESQFNFKLPFSCHCGDQAARQSSHLNTSRREQEFASSDHSDDSKPYKHLQGAILPPTFREMRSLAGQNAEVKYFIKITVRKPQTLSLNIRKEFPLTVSIPPPDPFPFDDQVMAASDMITLKKNKDGSHMGKFASVFKSSDSKMELTFRILFLRPRFIIRGQIVQPQVLILCDASPYEFIDDTKKSSSPESNGLGVFYLKRYDIKLESTTLFQAGAIHNTKLKKTKELATDTISKEIDLAGMIPFDDVPKNWMYAAYSSKYVLDISHIFTEVAFDNLTSTFQSCNINHRHTLKLRLKFGTASESWGSTKVDLDHHCVIVGPFPKEHEKEKLPEYSA